MVLLSETQADLLVEEMDVWLEDLEPLSSFILPTGPAPVAVMHLSRTVVRRLERATVRLMEHEGEGAVRALSLVYINRFSDWLFILGRWVSLQLNYDESLWVPLGQRPAEQGVAGRVRMMRSNDDDFTDL